MAKGYWIAHIDVNDAEAYKAYVAADADPFRKYGARFLVRGGRCESMEGRNRARTVVLEFKDYDTALTCYRSPEYSKARTLRQACADADIIVIEGYDGAQPTK